MKGKAMKKHIIRKIIKERISDTLENDYQFRDYYFLKASMFGKTSVGGSINLLRPSEYDIDIAVSRFARDGFSKILIYL